MNHWIVLLLILSACDVRDRPPSTARDMHPAPRLVYVDEYVFPARENFENTVVGGLSGIDYFADRWLVICDDDHGPIRYYNMDIRFSDKGFSKVEVIGSNVLHNENGDDFPDNRVDPESIRFVGKSGSVLWTSEGKIKKGVAPSIYRVSPNNDEVKAIALPSNLQLDKANDMLGPRHNGSLEGLCVDGKSFWVGMELPLKQDGEIPVINKTNSPVRLTKIGLGTGVVEAQYAYLLEPLSRSALDEDGLEINGLVEMLALEGNRLLVLERAYAQGHEDGGNNVKLYLVDYGDATDVYDVGSLVHSEYQPVKKTLLFDFESVRSQLTESRVDNIEGMCFGPELQSGNRSIVFVSDDNFQIYGHQLNQFLLFEFVE